MDDHQASTTNKHLKILKINILLYIHHSFPVYIGSNLYIILVIVRGTRWPSRLIHRATIRTFAGSIPDGVTGIFH